MILVLSPAKSLDFKTPARLRDFTQPEFLDQSQLLVNRLRTLSPLEIGKLLSISDKLAALNAIRYADWTRPFTAENAKQTVLAFNGDVYEGLDAKTLTRADLLFAQDRLRILSGLYGVLRPLDLMQAYRLEMGTQLANRRGKDLYAFWGKRIVDSLNVALQQAAAPALINLASSEYFKSIQTKRLVVPVIQPVFEDWSAGRFKVVSFFAKRARGLMARFAITGRLQAPGDLQQFEEEGYAYAALASDETRWVFRRKV
ncbi:peroxide stress protein YaaA [Propionivibrio sp.]|uniref:peroxide stress protein YaaA n=1 Tax=Propionivibrio sp. TaxID=2212460 RepID=UPI0025D83F42|nr:peroxide stress protein YaaA [Propionivibrio sp.]MBK7356278.1 peroxide stress protein YaaA [Propionivibrio sp.]MBK8746181.1 peroxide stress protein YaaA [Propionivibrio sp.]MBK8894508.1 peroxide stress protein YaaA [Propionivibrio sp.]MBL0208339.1 peroxide stress protein YaaA [Propionivibrio sp.]